MIYFTVTFSPEGLHNSSFFRGSVTASPDIYRSSRGLGMARREVSMCEVGEELYPLLTQNSFGLYRSNSFVGLPSS